MATHLDWYGCATFRLRTAGLTIMLDAYIDRMVGAEGPVDETGAPLTADCISECDWVVVGHSHFDHLYGAERIMTNTDAVGFVGASSLERMGVEASLTNLTKEFKKLKAPAAKKFGKRKTAKAKKK